MADTSDRPVIKLMTDYSAGLPLWGNWGDLKLPLSLLVRLYRWQRNFDLWFHHERGWDTTEHRDTWAREADFLVDDLRRAIGTRADLEVDLWPLQRESE